MKATSVAFVLSARGDSRLVLASLGASNLQVPFFPGKLQTHAVGGPQVRDWVMESAKSWAGQQVGAHG
jgi:hypothetical protein